jgi:hypothetical protein
VSRDKPPMSWTTVGNILHEFEKAGFAVGDQVHVGRPISLLRPVAVLYAGMRDSLAADPPAIYMDDLIIVVCRTGEPVTPSLLRQVAGQLDKAAGRADDAAGHPPERPMSAGGWASGPMP